MKKLTYLVILMFTSILLNTSCSKDESTSDTNTDPIVDNGCKLAVYRDDMNIDGDGLDSIFYSNNKISKATKYVYMGASKSLFLDGIDRYIYSGDEIKRYSSAQHNGTDWTERLDYTYTFNDSKISQIKSYEENLVTGEANFNYKNTNYYFTGDKIKYIFMLGEYPHFDLPTEYTKDSIVVTYDANGDNIAKVVWYKYDFKVQQYYKLFNCEYTFDNKTNPLRNFIPYLGTPYYNDDECICYFNKNNIVSQLYTTKDGVDTFSYLYTYDENNLPIRMGKSILGYSSDFKNYTYNCN